MIGTSKLVNRKMAEKRPLVLLGVLEESGFIETAGNGVQSRLNRME
jgi:hypothetical protein